MTRSPRLVPKKCEVTVSYDVVFPDTNVLVAYVMSRNSNSLVCAVFDKVRESDKLVVTNQVIDELYRIDLSRKNVTNKDITEALRRLEPTLVFVRNPSKKELEEVFIDDPNDRKILYSAKQVKASIILTNDNAWFRDNVSGINAEVMDLLGYMHQDGIRDGTTHFDKPNAGRIKKVMENRR